MISPKQFDIKHKTKPRREFDNPIVNKIFDSQFRFKEDDIDELVDSFEGDLKETVESFLNKFKAPMYEYKEEDDGPENKSRKKKNQISDNVINEITYKVFQNIKSYLGSEGKEMGRKSIKLEIDI